MIIFGERGANLCGAMDRKKIRQQLVPDNLPIATWENDRKIISKPPKQEIGRPIQTPRNSCQYSLHPHSHLTDLITRFW